MPQPAHLGRSIALISLAVAVLAPASVAGRDQSPEHGSRATSIASALGAIVAGVYEPVSAQTARRAAPPRWTRRIRTHRSIHVPASIDPTGRSDASRPLAQFLSRVPDGSRIVFAAGGVYRMDHGLPIKDRHDLVLAGNGATLRANPATISYRTPLDSLLSLQGGNRDIMIRGFRFDGRAQDPGVFRAGREHNHAILIQGERIWIHDVKVRAMSGDAFHIHESQTASRWSSQVYIDGAIVRSVGRNGVTIIAGKHVRVERSRFKKVGYVTLDIEPNRSDQGARDVLFRDNIADTWGDSFFSALGARGSKVEHIRIIRNLVRKDSLRTHVYLQTGRRKIAFKQNRSWVTASGPVLRFAYIAGLTVTGNRQPLSSGPLVSVTSSSDVLIASNTTQ